MKAIVYDEYGPPEEVLELREVDEPQVADGEVLVRVHASSVNRDDLEFIRGELFVRPSGLRRPRHRIPGSDIAGQVESIGKRVTRFRPGDEVFADLTACGFGAFAEYVSVPESALAPKPRNMSFEEAAAVPSAAVRALQGLRGRRPIQPGQRVLINGAGGGLGTFAIQLAKAFGAEVTGVDGSQKLELMLTVGADHVIDYTRAHFSESGRRFDLILDVAAYRRFEEFRAILACEKVLSADGICVVYMVGNLAVTIFQALFLRPWLKIAGSRRISVLNGRPNASEDVAFLRELAEAGRLRSVIDRRVGLGEVPAALRYVEEGHALGKVVVTL